MTDWAVLDELERLGREAVARIPGQDGLDHTPQRLKDYYAEHPDAPRWSLHFREITSATDRRTSLATILPGMTHHSGTAAGISLGNQTKEEKKELRRLEKLGGQTEFDL